MSEQNPTPTESTPKAETKAPAPVYAAYDKTFLRYVGGTHPTEAKAREAAKAAGVKSVEVRELPGR